MDSSQSPHLAPYFIVGIGASAGGLEAIRTLLKNAPRDVPAAYVVLLHMSPTQHSMLTPLIARETHLEVHELSDPVIPVPNHIYVAPPNADVIYAGGQLELTPPSTSLAAPKPSADRFFQSLADGAGRHAIGIVLSGTGSDGSAGVKAIREAGGITFAQDEKTAKYDGMPTSAIETGCVDLILSPADIGARLTTLSLTMPRLAEIMKEVMKDGADQEPLIEILQIVLARTRVDFRDYKPNTILRRLERRMSALGITSQHEYAAHCRAHEDEIDALFRDFLISVTRFFRDPGEYDILRTAIEQMVADTPDRPIRVWVAGCATGEEAYSVAMLLCEAMGGLQAARERGFQVFASDIDENALKAGRAGRYSLGALNDVPPNLVGPYFDIDEDSATVKRDLRAMVLFSVHNLVQDPPFLNIDLVCCRNLLIYFGLLLQDRAFSNFHYALREAGLVFIGTADNATASADLFEETGAGRKFLRKRNAGAIDYARRARQITYASPRRLPEPATPDTQPLRPSTAVTPMVTALVRSLGRDALLLSPKLDIVSVFGDVTPYIALASRIQPKLDHTLLAEPLSAEVRVLANMMGTNQTARRGFRRTVPGLPDQIVQMEMFYLSDTDLPEDLYLVVFTRSGDSAGHNTGTLPAPDVPSSGLPSPDLPSPDLPGSRLPGSGLPGPAQPETLLALQDELTQTRDALNQSVERWETANEELKSANEELQSNNEELQSVNEEMETSNEELQSTNEELITLNEAYQVQTDELTEVNEEMDAVLSQLEPALLIFDARLSISKFSHSAARLFRIPGTDTKPHLSQLALPPGFPPLAPIADRALRLGQTAVEEFAAENRLYRLSCAPYANTRSEVQGATLIVTSAGTGT